MHPPHLSPHLDVGHHRCRLRHHYPHCGDQGEEGPQQQRRTTPASSTSQQGAGNVRHSALGNFTRDGPAASPPASMHRGDGLPLSLSELLPGLRPRQSYLWMRPQMTMWAAILALPAVGSIVLLFGSFLSSASARTTSAGQADGRIRPDAHRCRHRDRWHRHHTYVVLPNGLSKNNELSTIEDRWQSLTHL